MYMPKYNTNISETKQRKFIFVIKFSLDIHNYINFVAKYETLIYVLVFYIRLLYNVYKYCIFCARKKKISISSIERKKNLIIYSEI